MTRPRLTKRNKPCAAGPGTPTVPVGRSDRRQASGPQQTEGRHVLSETLQAITSVGMLVFIVGGMASMGLGLTIARMVEPLRD